MKKVLTVVLAGLLLLTFAACSGNKTKANAVKVSVIAAQYGQNTTKWWADFVKEFNESHGDIVLNVEVVSWNDIYTIVNTRIANGDAPDVLNIDVFADYQSDGLLLPAKDYISETTYAKMYPSFLAQSEIDGTVWAVPDLASARAMYYNKDIFDAAGVAVPTTWKELKAACEAIKAYDGSLYPWGVDMTTDEGQAAFAYYIWNNGGDFTDAQGNWALNSAKNVEAIEFVIDLYKNGLTNTDPANETRYMLQDMFGTGQLAMVIAPNSLPTYIADGGHTVNFGVAPIPNNSGASVSAGVMDRFMCFAKAGRSEAELAAITEFFDYFYEDNRYSEWVLMEGFLPATSAGAEAMAAADPAQKEWIDIVGSCKFYPVAKAEWADVKQGVINVEQNALIGGDIQSLLDRLQKSVR